MAVKRTSNTAKLRVAIPRGAGVGVRKAAEEVAELAVAGAPEKTGELKRSIKVRGVNQHRTDVAVEAPHGPHVEFGTTNMPARPFLLPAAEAVRTRLASIVAAAVKDEIR